MNVSTEAVRTLMEVGVAAAGAGLFKEAITIFDGVDAVRPDGDGASIGNALIFLFCNANDDAAKLLREALERNPGSVEMKMLLGLALRLGGRTSELDKVLGELKASDDPKGKEYAEALAAR